MATTQILLDAITLAPVGDAAAALECRRAEERQRTWLCLSDIIPFFVAVPTPGAK